MTETLFALVAEWGIGVILAATFLSCLFVPMPSSALMLAGGAFAAAGDLVAWQAFAAAWIGAVAGDQAGFRLGRLGGPAVNGLIDRKPARARMRARAARALDRHGGLAVFFSTWAVAPLGPWVNLVAGATGLGWLRFTLWDAAGEAIWVTLYTGLGYTFATRIEDLAALTGNAAGFAAAAVLAVGLGALLLARRRRRRPARPAG
jgi:membrane protein DedA with SNARE-associated domain